MLWSRLNNSQLGFKFRRQHPELGYVLDFYCHEAKLALELDGWSHDDRQEYDAEREEVLRDAGIEILRFPNLEVIQHLDRTVDSICQECIRIIGRDPAGEEAERLNQKRFET